MLFRAPRRKSGLQRRRHNPDHFMRARDDKLLLMEIREGLEKKEFTFFLQPQVREQTGKIVGAEALCRRSSLRP